MSWLVFLMVGCAGPGGEDGGEGEGDGESGSEDDGGTGGIELAQLSDACELAPELGTGTWTGSLRGTTSSLGGACGLGGPDAFLRVVLDYPADLRVQARGVAFLPRVGLLPSDCVPGRELDCAQSLPAALDDLGAGTEILVSVGIDPDDPALSLAPPLPSESGPDPLDFEVDVLVRRILEPGAYCLPASVGRCATGSACLVSAEDGVARCELLEADTCAAPQLLALPATTPAPVLVEIDPLQPQSDAHHHTCTGARLRERVIRIALAPETSPTAQLRVSVTDPEVGLALRSPGCAPEDEIACAPAGPSTSVTFPEAGAVAASGESPFLFVELPEPPSDPAPEPPDPIELAFEVVDG